MKDFTENSFNNQQKASEKLKNLDIQDDLRGLDTVNFAAKNLQIERPGCKYR